MRVLVLSMFLWTACLAGPHYGVPGAPYITVRAPPRDHCEDRQYNLMLGLNQKKPIDPSYGKCELAECQPNGQLLFKACSRLNLGKSNCRIARGQPYTEYPKCCDYIECPDRNNVYYRFVADDGEGGYGDGVQSQQVPYRDPNEYGYAVY